MKKKFLFTICIIFVLGLIGCSNKAKNIENVDVSNMSYEDIESYSKESTVNFYGYGGNEVMNKWFDTYVIPQMKEKHNITVKRVGMDIENIMNKLISEKQAGNASGNIDVVWLNGENFKSAKDNSLLFGPFVDKLPNYEKYIDKDSEDVKIDFGTSVEGLEAPFGKAQFVIAVDDSKITDTITNSTDLEKIIKANPGKFTYPALPDFTGSAFVRNIIYDIVGYDNVKDLPEDKEIVRTAIKPAMEYLNSIKPYLWNNGRTYPATSAQLENMYSDAEVYFTMTYSPNALLGMIETGEFSKNTKIIEFDKGNISNTHFLAIPGNSKNKAGAIMLINFLTSIDAQASKNDIKNWGDVSVLDKNKINEEDMKKFGESISIEKSLPELKAGLVPIIEEIWMEEVLEGEK
ncbi:MULTISPECIES: ABC transporter substrate-binding protein [Clostridium]|uniref:ABC transporter substrate-binding protein n=1 Tax=Clostridium senegalense TaxID=1465809 RepID=A0A6M0H6C1_9CLOT|nr:MULTISPECIES: ABC transporter substrate-binding protein [Clostridium]NEU05824.1 ABC transporter substrate-binding protein [Clostridium senegalense]